MQGPQSDIDDLLIMYADDIALITETKEQMRRELAFLDDVFTQ